MCVGLTCVCSMVTYVFVHEWLYNHSTNIHKFRNKRGGGVIVPHDSLSCKRMSFPHDTQALFYLYVMLRAAAASSGRRHSPGTNRLKYQHWGGEEEADLNLDFAVFTSIFPRRFENHLIGSRQDLLGCVCTDISQYIDIFLSMASPSP